MATANEFTPTGDSPREADDSQGIKGALQAALAEHEKANAGDGGEEGDGEAGGAGQPEQKDDKTSTEVKEPKEGEKAPVEAKAGDKGEKVEQGAAGKADADKKPDADKALEQEFPKWSAKHREMFKALPKDAQEFLATRYKETEADYTRKTQELATIRKDYEAVDQIFSPQRDRMKAAGLTASQIIQGWANAEMALQAGKGLELIPNLAKAYRLDPVKLASEILRVGGVTDPKALEQAAAAAAETAKNLPPAVALPPEVMQRLDKVDRVIAHVEGQQRTTAEAEVARINSEIDKFKNATDAQGAPLHPHFDELMDDMARLVDQATAAKRPVPPIDQLYQDAIFANPAVRQKWLDAKLATERSQTEAAQRAATEKAAAEARAKSQKARKAGSSVTGSAGTGQPLSSRRNDTGSLRQTIASAVDETEQVVH